MLAFGKVSKASPQIVGPQEDRLLPRIWDSKNYNAQDLIDMVVLEKNAPVKRDEAVKVSSSIGKKSPISKRLQIEIVDVTHLMPKQLRGDCTRHILIEKYLQG